MLSHNNSHIYIIFMSKFESERVGYFLFLFYCTLNETAFPFMSALAVVFTMSSCKPHTLIRS